MRRISVLAFVGVALAVSSSRSRHRADLSEVGFAVHHVGSKRCQSSDADPSLVVLHGLSEEIPCDEAPAVAGRYQSILDMLVNAVMAPPQADVREAQTISNNHDGRPLVAGGSSATEDDASWFDGLFGPVGDAPEQIHLGFGDSASPIRTNVSVMWLTSPGVTDGQVCVSCDDGEDAAAPSTCFDAASYTYTPISLLPWHGSIHRAFMPALPAAERCTYRVGPQTRAANATLWSQNYTFTVPAPDKQDRELFVALGGDMGTIQLVGYKMARQMLEYDSSTRRFDAFWHLGDIAYSTLDPPHDNFEFFWDMYLRQEQSLLNHIPALFTYGNHDLSGGDSGAFINRFFNPRLDGGNANFYFAKRQGPVMYISMCTEIAINPTECTYEPGTHQYRWLEATLAGVNRSETPWVILAGHRPMYSSDTSTDSGPLQDLIEPLILRYGVDLQLAGHMHCTELTSPVASNVANLTGVTNSTPTSFVFSKPSVPVHATVGTLGALIRESYVDPQPQWSLFRSGTLLSDTYGFATLQATTTSLTLEFHRQSTGETMWDVTITK